MVHKAGCIWLHAPQPPEDLLEGSVSVPNQAGAAATSLDKSRVHLRVQLHLFAAASEGQSAMCRLSWSDLAQACS